MLHHLNAIALAAMLAASAGAAFAQQAPDGFAGDPRLGEQVNRMCFGRSINGFEDATDRTVVLRARVNDHYLVETAGYCPDLDWAQSIGLDQFSSCLTRGDSIIPFDSVFGASRSGHFGASRSGHRGFPCRIRAIYEWNPDAGEPGEADGEHPAR